MGFIPLFLFSSSSFFFSSHLLSVFFASLPFSFCCPLLSSLLHLKLLLFCKRKKGKRKSEAMTQPSTIPQRFVSKPNQLGIVAVGFSGGQVRIICFILVLSLLKWREFSFTTRAKQASNRPLWP